MTAASVHPSAIVETDRVGEDTRVWAFTHILAGASIGARCNIGDHCFVESGVVVGDDVTVKNGNALYRGVTLEDGVFVGPAVVFTNDLRPRSPRLSQAAQRYADDGWLVPTLVRTGATLGASAILLAGITVGSFAFVAAGALVTRDVPAHALVAGAPATVRGWVCECGERLELDAGEGRCRSCGRSFRQHGDGLIATG
jgi:UDP-2-acetamido-3-amino-2,3-dideoxy-glucuronate N-acetyltransferase